MISSYNNNEKIKDALEKVFSGCAVIRGWQSQWETEYHQEVEHFGRSNETFQKIFNELVFQAKYFYDVDVVVAVKKSCKKHIGKLTAFDWVRYDEGSQDYSYEIGDCIVADHANLDELNFEDLQKVMAECKLEQIIPVGSKEHIQVQYLYPYFEEAFQRYSLDVRPEHSRGKRFKKFLNFDEVAPFDRKSEPMKAIVQAFVKHSNALEGNVTPVSIMHLVRDLLSHYKEGVFKVIYPIMNLQGGQPLKAGDVTANLTFHNLSQIEDWNIAPIVEGVQKLETHLLNQSKVDKSSKPRKQLNKK